MTSRGVFRERDRQPGHRVSILDLTGQARLVGYRRRQIQRVLLILVAYGLLWSLAWEILAPFRPELRLVPLSDERARRVATIVAVVLGGMIAMMKGPAGMGSGGLLLWPLFGATNQLLAGLAFMVTTFYLWRRNKPVWFVVFPMIFMIVLPGILMIRSLLMTEFTRWMKIETVPWIIVSAILISQTS